MTDDLKVNMHTVVNNVNKVKLFLSPSQFAHNYKETTAAVCTTNEKGQYITYLNSRYAYHHRYNLYLN